MKSRNYFEGRNAIKLIAILLTAVVISGVFLANIGSTLASPEDFEIEFSCESGVTEGYTVEKGAELHRTSVNLFDAYSADPAVATVQFTRGTSSNNVTITGVKAGVVGVAVGTKKGVVTNELYQVTDSENISAYKIVGGYEVRFAGTEETQASPVQIPAGKGDFSRIKWSSKNEGVATVDQNGEITTTGIGATIVIGKFTDKWGIDRELHLLVIVGTIVDGTDPGDGGDPGDGTDPGDGGEPGDGTDPGDGGESGEPEKPITEVGVIEEGRVLGNDLTGDGEWVTLAKNGDYVLIMRKDFINVHGNKSFDGNASFQGTYYDIPAKAGTPYSSSNLRSVVNGWFNPSLSFDNTKLSSNARVRDYTVKNDAVSKTGTYNDIYSGFSKPIPVYDRTGTDVAFVLSYGEATNFCSKENKAGVPSPAIASANFAKINTKAIPEYNQNPFGAYWLRTLGSINDSTSTPQRGTTCATTSLGFIGEHKTTAFGAANVADVGLIYPALWVHVSIFDKTE